MSTEIQWEEPPERTRRVERPGKYDAVMAALKEHPGRSAVVHRGKSANTTWWKKQGFEATSRLQPDGTFKTYACWPIGKDPEVTDDEAEVPVVVKPAQKPSASRAGTVQKDPNGALAAGGETTGTCTECRRPRCPIGRQDRICRTCRLNHAARKAL
ncbi:hypothetical protein [Micrococcus lylae]|uniref:hypothetical protein n=1 Tax=Micrococcus lylae TaxID=1273 RepID=UPI000C7F9B18|nr:hypothetical protein [Micrococcus lylae]WIK82137.1 hypothetical protein CJ228_011215 [Micrococcus lylae]